MIGETLSGKFEIRQLLGSGSLTSVYLARDAAQGRMVAVKVLLQHFAADPEMVDRFLDAAKRSMAIKHKHVVQVLSVGRDEWKEAPYLVMELLRGRTLEEALVKTGPIPQPEAARLMGQVLSGLAAAHQKGVVHADLRPGHAFLYAAVGGPESVKVFDFGLARVLAPSTGRRPADDRTPRTPHALSPEWLADGGKVDARSDIFAAGAMLHSMLTGQLPLGFQTMPDLVKAVTEGADCSAVVNEPGVGQGLGAVIAKALDKDPSRRFQCAEDMAQAIADAPSAPAQPARIPPPPRPLDQAAVAPPPRPPDQAAAAQPPRAGKIGAAPPRPGKIGAPPPRPEAAAGEAAKPGQPAAAPARPAKPADQYTGADLVSWDEDASDTEVEPIPGPKTTPDASPEKMKEVGKAAGPVPGKDLDETPTGVRTAMDVIESERAAAAVRTQAEAKEEEEALAAPTLPPPKPPGGKASVPPATDLGKVDDWGALPLPEIEPPSIEELEAASFSERVTRPPTREEQAAAGRAGAGEEEAEEAEEIEEVEEVEEIEEVEEEAAAVEPVGLVEPPGGYEIERRPGDTSIDIFLEAVEGPCRGTICPVRGDGVVVGRAKDADLSVMDPVVSRRHARFRLENGAVVVEDMGSSFGTWVNGEKVQSARVKPGDKVSVGASVFVVNYPGKG